MSKNQSIVLTLWLFLQLTFGVSVSAYSDTLSKSKAVDSIVFGTSTETFNEKSSAFNSLFQTIPLEESNSKDGKSLPSESDPKEEKDEEENREKEEKEEKEEKVRGEKEQTNSSKQNLQKTKQALKPFFNLLYLDHYQWWVQRITPNQVLGKMHCCLVNFINSRPTVCERLHILHVLNL